MFKGHFLLRITNKLYNLFKQSRQLNGFAVRRLIRVKLLITVSDRVHAPGDAGQESREETVVLTLN